MNTDSVRGHLSGCQQISADLSRRMSWTTHPDVFDKPGNLFPDRRARTTAWGTLSLSLVQLSLWFFYPPINCDRSYIAARRPHVAVMSCKGSRVPPRRASARPIRVATF